MPLADTLLRLAESPSLYTPKWSDQIMQEVTRTLVTKFGVSPLSAAYRTGQIQKAFPDSWVEGYKVLIPAMANQEKDRHVLAAAIRSEAKAIVTFNQKDFPPSALDPWGIRCLGPSTFLRALFELEPAIVTEKLNQQAEDISIPLHQLLANLEKLVPAFVTHFRRTVP